MAWRKVHGYKPLIANYWILTGSSSTNYLTSTQTRVGVVFMMPRSGTIEKLAFMISSVTTAQDLSIGLYTVDSNGNPTTTNYGGSESATLPASQVTGGVKEITLPTSAEASAGDIVAFIVEWASTPGDIALRHAPSESTLPYPCRYSSGSWTKDSANPIQSLIRYSDGSYAVAGSGLFWESNTFFNINSSPDERGNLFQLPFGVRFRRIDITQAEGAAFDVVVYLGNDSYSISVPTYTPSHPYRGKALILPTLIEVPADTPFRIVVKPTTGTNVSGLRSHQFVNAGHKDAYIGGLADAIVKMTTRTDGGTWTDHDTQIHIISPVVTEIETTAVGAGGFPFPPHVIIT